MEPDTTPTGPVKPPPLNSDQLNYLIWRYLQESGYGEAAVKLQRDWNVKAENLPFTKHIKGHALISLVQKGLRYHHLSLTIDENGQQTKKLEPSMFFFGPNDARPDSSRREMSERNNEMQRVASPLSASGAIPKKRETDANGNPDAALQPAKRSRKTATNNDRNGAGARKPSAPPNYDSSTMMDVDSVNGQAIPRNVRSPSAGESLHDENTANGVSIDQRMDVDMDATTPTGMHEPMNNLMPALVHTLTNGESVGVQVAPAKVANLSPSAAVLSVAEKSPITKADWRPGDWSKLTTSGHSFCGICQLNGQSNQSNGLHPPYKSLLEPSDDDYVTAFAWSSKGSLLAVATHAEQGGQIHIFDGADLALIERLPGSQRVIASLKWLPESSSLVGIVPRVDGNEGDHSPASILTWDVSAMLEGQVFGPDTQELPLSETLLDMDTAEGQNQGLVYAAGRNAIYKYTYQLKSGSGEEKQMETLETLPAPSEIKDDWSFIRCRSQNLSGEAVIAASADSACIWLPHRNVVKYQAHTQPITGLQMRPRAFELDSGVIPDFATSSIDGSIKVWNYHAHTNSINILHKLMIDRATPIMAIAFAPDGFCLAGASYDEARIWNAEHGYNLMASWQSHGSEWQGASLKEREITDDGTMSSVNGDAGFGVSEHALSWDSDSKKLAFGLGSQVAVIDFQR